MFGENVTQLYIESCAELNVKVNPEVVNVLQAHQFLASPTVPPNCYNINFSSTYLGAHTIKALLPVLKACGPPGTLGFSKCGVQGDALKALMTLIREHHSVHTIDLSHNRLGTPEAHAILTAVRANPSITAVNMVGTLIVPSLQNKIQRRLDQNRGSTGDPTTHSTPWLRQVAQKPPAMMPMRFQLAELEPTSAPPLPEEEPPLPLWVNVVVNHLKDVLHRFCESMKYVIEVFDDPGGERPSTRSSTGDMPIARCRTCWAVLTPKLDALLADTDRDEFMHILEEARSAKEREAKGELSEPVVAQLAAAAKVNATLDERLATVLSAFGFALKGMVKYEEAVQVRAGS